MLAAAKALSALTKAGSLVSQRSAVDSGNTSGIATSAAEAKPMLNNRGKREK
jgi:hypothetical protein